MNKEECLKTIIELSQALKVHGQKIMMAGKLHDHYVRKLNELDLSLTFLPPNDCAWVEKESNQFLKRLIEERNK